MGMCTSLGEGSSALPQATKETRTWCSQNRENALEQEPQSCPREARSSGLGLLSVGAVVLPLSDVQWPSIMGTVPTPNMQCLMFRAFV